MVDGGSLNADKGIQAERTGAEVADEQRRSPYREMVPIISG
jgi:hypothetical protein